MILLLKSLICFCLQVHFACEHSFFAGVRECFSSLLNKAKPLWPNLLGFPVALSLLSFLTQTGPYQCFFQLKPGYLASVQWHLTSSHRKLLIILSQQ